MEQKQYSVALVDDDQDTLVLYEDVLRTAGFKVTTAVDGLDGLEKINQFPPDLVITGIIMPRMDGFMLFEALKKNVNTMNVPVMFLSHLGRQEDEVRARAIGAKDFFVTSLTPPQQIIGRVKALLSGGEYFITINPYELDAQRLARDLDLNRDFLCSDGGEKLALRLTLRDAQTRKFDADLKCV